MRIHEITLGGLDLARMRRYYCGILGLREVSLLEDGRLALQAGGTRLVYADPLSLDPTLPAGWHGRYHLAFDIPPARFDAALSWLGERGGLLASPEGQTRFHSQTWNSDSLYFLDPQGNILELIARHDAPQPGDLLPGDRPFQSTEILGVSEAGLAVASVADAAAHLMERMPGLKEYKDGAEDFLPLGSVGGLLILVRTGRIWFPHTGVAAQPLPIDLKVELENGQRYHLQAPPFPFTVSAER